MRKLPDTTGFIGYGETSWETGSPSETPAGKVFYEDLIRKANSVPLTQIFKHYNIHVSQYHRTVTCPFRSHKGGRESTPSFNYFPETNSFCCFGCKKGSEWSHGVEFIAYYEGVIKFKAAIKILEIFGDYVSNEDGEFFDYENSEDTLEIMLDFSNAVREFRDTYTDEKSQEFIERLCKLYDDLYAGQNHKRKFKNEALRRAVEILKRIITNYKPCLTP